ncbi:MAG: response regulator transcription factor [Elusimicrobiota bacterium]
MSVKEKILVVDDEKHLIKVLAYNLEKEGYRVSTAADGEVAVDIFRKEKPDLVILDLMLPKLDGFEVCKTIRRESCAAVLMLTAKGEEVDKVLGLELGADDYMTKPFSVRELMARVKAILKRMVVKGAKVTARAGGIEVDFERYETRVDGRSVELSPKEFAFLKCLLVADGKALTREQLLEKVWGYDDSVDIDTNTVDQHIARLRQKLVGEAGRVITVKNVGYRLKFD